MLLDSEVLCGCEYFDLLYFDSSDSVACLTTAECAELEEVRRFWTSSVGIAVCTICVGFFAAAE